LNYDIFFSDASKLAELIRTKEISPVELVKAHLDSVETVNPQVNAIVTVADGARSREEGRSGGSRWRRAWAAPRHPLHRKGIRWTPQA